MTTEQNTPQEEVLASEQTVSAEEEIADQILAADKAPEVEKKPEPTPATPAFDADELIARVERTVQGRTVNSFGQFKREMKQEIDAALAPIREFTTRVEQAQVEQLEPEQQVEYWRKKALQQQSAPTPEPEQQAEGAYSSQEQQEITASVNGMLELAGLDVAINDNRLWEGYQPGDSPARIKQIARTNIRKMQAAAAPPAAPPAPVPAQPAPAPSTSGAPRRSASTINNRAELYRIMADPDDPRIANSSQMNGYLRQLREDGQVTL